MLTTLTASLSSTVDPVLVPRTLLVSSLSSKKLRVIRGSLHSWIWRTEWFLLGGMAQKKKGLCRVSLR